VLSKFYSYGGDIWFLGKTMFVMQNKDRLCPFADSFRSLMAVSTVEAKYKNKEKHRAPEPEYGQDFVELFNMVFEYDRAKRPDCT
jgi:hypothetical protein